MSEVDITQPGIKGAFSFKEFVFVRKRDGLVYKIKKHTFKKRLFQIAL